MKVRSKVEIPVLKIRKGATKKEIYAAVKKAFTAADLQKYTEIEPMIPAEEVLADMKKVHRQIVLDPKKKRK